MMATATRAPLQSASSADRRHRSVRWGGLIVALAAVALLCFLSLAVGARTTSLSTVWQAVAHYDPSSTDQLVIRELRLPRTILGVLVGAALGLAGAGMQGGAR